MSGIIWMLTTQRKLTAFLIASGLLLGGLWVPCDDAKYGNFALAVAGLAAALVGAHAFGKTEKGGDSGKPDPDAKPDSP